VPKVRDAIRLIEIDGWILVRIKGSHRQYKHPSKPGIVTMAGNQSGPWNLEQHIEAGGFEITGEGMKYVVVYEQTSSGWSAYVPDLPGCVAAGKTRKGAEDLVREAIPFHLEGLRKADELIPEPGAWTETVEVAI
jgi:predicted RNase H-like HicB family nuclease